MQAFIFDIDGTLLDSFDTDGEMFAEAIRAVLGNVRIRDTWGMYEHVTDNGILADVARDNGLQLPQPVKSITYYGDGEWDMTATSRLGWNFAPVGAKLGGLTRFVSTMPGQ